MTVLEPATADLPVGRRPLSRVLVHAPVALFTVLVFVFILAVSTGGLRLVAIYGSSMAPEISSGDLVVVRGDEAYDVGDVVAFHSETLERVVVHRIVGKDGGRFVLQGDANSWRDLDRPREHDLLGRVALRVPAGGSVLRMLQDPATLIVLGIAFAATFAIRRLDDDRDPASV